MRSCHSLHTHKSPYPPSGRVGDVVAMLQLCAFCVGSLIGLVCRAIPTLHGDKIIIGDIMLLIPGLAFTNAVKDIFIGDTISGVMRLIETVLWAAALALGFALSGWLLGV